MNMNIDMKRYSVGAEERGESEIMKDYRSNFYPKIELLLLDAVVEAEPISGFMMNTVYASWRHELQYATS